MKKILVIDDEQSTLSMCRLFLGTYGYRVLTADNAEDGFAVFEKERPPIVLTDVKMPGPDGLSLLKRIKEAVPETEVIVVTGHGDQHLAGRALELDASGFLSKPLQTEEIESALRRAEEKLGLSQ